VSNFNVGLVHTQHERRGRVGHGHRQPDQWQPPRQSWTCG
jgi:hypothetical protein